MFDRLTERLAPVPPKRTVTLSASVTGNSATVQLGDRSFDLSSDFRGELSHNHFDFALFGAAAIALRNNWNIQTDLPITAKAAQAVNSAVDLLDMWRVRRCYQVRFDCTNIVGDKASLPDQGLICLSGGVDSTFAAMKKARSGEISHGVLLAGADYPSGNHPGFVELLARVRGISSRIGIETICAETTIRKFKLYWPISHVFVLAMVLAFHASRFGKGYIAADFTAAQEYAYHPWGNCGPLVAVLGGTGFPIQQAGQSVGRTAKLAFIAGEDPHLMKEISVCYSAKDSSGNCGICEKCVRTKLNLVASGISYQQFFSANPELADHLRRLSLPKTQAGLRRHMVFLKDIRTTMPDATLGAVLESRLKKLRNQITPLGKI